MTVSSTRTSGNTEPDEAVEQTIYTKYDKVSFQKISILPSEKRLEMPGRKRWMWVIRGVRGMKTHVRIPEEWGKSLPWGGGGGLDIFWKYTITLMQLCLLTLSLLDQINNYLVL